MPNKYRFILGKRVDTSVNLVTNGTFTGDATGWSLGVQWEYTANTVEVGRTFCTGTSVINDADFIIRQNGVISPNSFYYLSYDSKAKACGTTGLTGFNLAWSIGGTYMNYIEEYDRNISTGSFTTFIHENLFAPAGNDLVFYSRNPTDDVLGGGSGSGFLDNVLLYKYVWNDPLDFDPLNWDNARITKKRDEVLNGLIVEYIMDLVFINDGYDYLYDQYLTNGFCAEIPIRIEIFNTTYGAYEFYFEGLIYISDCTFDITKRQVKVNVEDINASLLFKRSKDVKVSLIEPQSPAPFTKPIIAPEPIVFIGFNNDIGTPGVYGSDCYDVSILLRRIIIKASNYRLDAESVFFTSGLFDDFCIGFIKNLRLGTLPSNDIQKLSIKQLFDELNNLFDLSFSITTNADGVPTIKIEDKISYLSSTPVLTLNRVNEIEFVFDKTNILRVVQIGYEHIDDTPTTTFLDIPEGVQYSTNNLCSDKKLNLVSKHIQSSSVLKKVGSGIITNDKYDTKLFWIETDGTNTINSGSGTHDYNINIETEDNMERWVETLQFGFLQSDLIITDKITKTNPILDKIYSFKFPLTKAEFDSIVQAYNTIDFNTDGTGLTTINGYLLEANYEIRTGITEFKLLA